MKHIVITGSHRTPAESLIEAFPDSWQAHYLSSEAGPKLERYNLFSLINLYRLPGAIAAAKKQLKNIGAAAVVSFGGYSALPYCLAAKLLKIPLVIHEQTLGAGMTNRLTGLMADKIAVSWLSSRRFFTVSKLVLTGNPVRQKVLAVKRNPGNVLYICGGSQGSLAINRALAPILPPLLKKFIIYHQYGKQQPLTSAANYFARPYFEIDELVKIYARVRAAVSRSGINTVTEMACVKIPAVLIPLPYTQKNEQETNAAYLKKLGLAVVLKQAQLTPAALLESINKVIDLKPAAMKAEFPRARVAGAAKKLYQVVESLAK